MGWGQIQASRVYIISRAHVSYSTAYNCCGRENGDSQTGLIEFGTEIYERMNLIGSGCIRLRLECEPYSVTLRPRRAQAYPER